MTPVTPSNNSTGRLCVAKLRPSASTKQLNSETQSARSSWQTFAIWTKLLSGAFWQKYAMELKTRALWSKPGKMPEG